MDGGFMVFELTPKKRTCGILITLVLLLGLSITWCINAMQSRNYPFLISSRWECNDIPFVLTYVEDSNGSFTSYAELTWNNRVIPVDIGFLMREYDVYPVKSSSYKDRLFGGTWKYRKGDLILIIEEDFFFDNQYSELTFSPVE